MARIGFWLVGISAVAVGFSHPCAAQQPEATANPAPVEVEATPLAPADAPVAPEATEPNPDEMANYLNSQQQLKQTFTVTRTINGEVVETDKRTITYSRDDPIRPTEAGVTPMEALRAAFDREVLTRTEAYEEAKLDFVVADRDRNGAVTADEFATLVASWRADVAREAKPTDEDTARQRQYRAFVEELDPEGAKAEHDAEARAKFAFMAGAAGALSRETYIREYLLDFDSMDADADLTVKGEELLHFRALNRGEKIDD